MSGDVAAQSELRSEPSSDRTKIRIEDLEVIYQRPDGSTTRAVDRVSLDVPPGTFLTLIGPSGCGKTSLLNAIGGLVRPSGGRVLIDDALVRGPQPKKCAYIFQDFALFPWRTALGNVEVALEFQRMRRHDRRERALAALETVGLAGIADRYPRELSGGMKQGSRSRARSCPSRTFSC
jgi:NitT/TauT family transport system ATP-binding protein